MARVPSSLLLWTPTTNTVVADGTYVGWISPDRGESGAPHLVHVVTGNGGTLCEVLCSLLSPPLCSLRLCQLVSALCSLIRNSELGSEPWRLVLRFRSGTGGDSASCVV